MNSIFKSLPSDMIAYIPNHLAANGSPAKKGYDLGHIWIKYRNKSGIRYIFDKNHNHLFSGCNDEIREFYSCNPTSKFNEA